MNHRSFLLLLFGACLLASACKDGGSGKSPFTFVGFTGSLRFADGKPVQRVRVKLVPFETAEGYEGSPAEGITDENGVFTPQTEGVGRIYFGRYKIVLEPLKPDAERTSVESPIPPRYRSLETSDRKLDVTKTGPRAVTVLLERE